MAAPGFADQAGRYQCSLARVSASDLVLDANNCWIVPGELERIAVHGI